MGPLRSQIRAMCTIYFNSLAQSMFFVVTAKFVIRSGHALELIQMRVIGDTIGLIISSITMHRYGRKPSLIIFITPAFLYWILITFSEHPTVLKTGIFFGGLSTGGTVNLGAIMIGEYSSPKYRAIFLYLNNFSYMVSGMFSVIMIFTVDNRVISIFGIICSSMSLVFSLGIPETPYWLAWNKQYQASEEAFKFLRGSPSEYMREYKQLVEKNTQDTEQKTTYLQKIVLVIKSLFKKEFLKPSALMILAMILVDMSGKHFFSVCSAEIMHSFSRSRKVQEINYHFLVTLIMVGTSVLSTILVKLMKQRTLLFSTGFPAWGLLTLLSFFSIIASSNKPETTIAFFALYFILAQISCAPLPIVIMGEIFPYNYKSFGLILAGFSDILLKISVELITPFLLDRIKIHFTLFTYSLLMGICLFILFYELPETKGVTLQQIEAKFKEQPLDWQIEHDDHENAVIAMEDCPYCSRHLV